MKILMVSIPSLHFFRWTEQLQDSGHEVYWFDISGMSQTVERINWVQQKVNWKLKRNYAGRTFIKKRFPRLYKFLQKHNEYDTAKKFEEYLLEVQPDVVHSFALHLACSPIAEVMKRSTSVKWIYSSWGSDLYARKNTLLGKRVISDTLPFIDYIFTDCKRDYEIAKEFGFRGKLLGIFPGGGGFNLKLIQTLSTPHNQRKLIVVKGYQDVHGDCISVLEILALMKKQLAGYEIVVFGANDEVIKHVNNEKKYTGLNLLIKQRLPHKNVLELMGKAKIYIGYSQSDGMPNTLLEAICCGCLPLQSNPGGATSEIITDGFNGLLLDKRNMQLQILKALKKENYCEGLKYNKEILSPLLSFDFLKNKVLKAYNEIKIFA
ncbi:glycosyltransferase [Flavobacterium antarcticum]|uniref:glycosyltransferase n=1 Tax=Flavobacterium antarcticum TaxID=271155 RepID=UPI0003B593EA|nr:glycosyltransferase [Flavobacterium antarcticum]